MCIVDTNMFSVETVVFITFVPLLGSIYLTDLPICCCCNQSIPHPPWPLLISDVGLELEGTLINCS